MSDRAEKVIAKINLYRESKSDTMFDDFYRADLDYMEECIEIADSPRVSTEDLQKLRHIVWLEDIPSSTVPEYKEHHESIQTILKEIDALVTRLVQEVNHD